MAEKPLPRLAGAEEAGTAARASVLVKIEEAQFKSIERLVVLFTNVSDNLYNIAGFMGAQLTSLKETEEALKAMVPKEGDQIETKVESKGKEKDKEKEKNPLQKLIDFFDNLINILIPFLVGFFIGLKKEFALIGALVLLFRKQIFAVLKELPKVIAFMASFLKTAITNAINSLSKAFKGLSAKFPSISGKVAEKASSVVNTLRGVIVGYSAQIEKVSKVFTKIVTGFKNITQKISAAGTKLFSFFKGESLGKAVDFVVDSFRQVGKFFKLVGRIAGISGQSGSIVTKAIESISKMFTAGAKVAGKMGMIIRSVSRFLGPIGVVISTITALFKGITQAFKGFDEEGVFGAIKGFTSGIISGLVGWIGDLGTWLTGKLLKMLGFEELGEKIASFDFTEFLNVSIQGAFDTVTTYFGNMITAIPNIFSKFADNISEAFSKIFSGDDILGGIVDVLSAIPSMLIDLITAPFKALGDAIKEVFDFDVGALSKKLMLSIAPPDSWLGKLIGTGSMEEANPEGPTAVDLKPQDEEKDKPKDTKDEEKDKPKDTKKKEPEKKNIEPPPVQRKPIGKEIERAEVKEGVSPGLKPLPQQPARGDALAAESQRVAGARQTGGGRSQNIVAPNTTTNVNQSSSQNVSIRPSAAPTFGMGVSHSDMGRPAFGF